VVALAVSGGLARRSGQSFIVAQERERAPPKRSGGTITIDRPKPKAKAVAKKARKTDPALDKDWSVLLHNDDVHTFDYVTECIVKVVKTLHKRKAYAVTVEAHSRGIAVVTMTFKQQAKIFCLQLQKYGLTVSIAPGKG
jgi:ATP-dependent Clp protease adapter protein ClpS